MAGKGATMGWARITRHPQRLISVRRPPRPSGTAPAARRFETEVLADDTEPLVPGTMLGDYRIERLLGCGGMCKVYLAQQQSLKRPVAVKVFEGIAGNAEQLDLFRTEIRTTAKVNHRNIVTAIESGVVGDQYFFSMNFIDGDTIEEIVARRGPFEEARALEIIGVVAEALAYLHNRLGISHKDIKPGNIMIDREGEVFLLDLGIAEYVGNRDPDTVIGSPCHMSPEQILGKPLDWRTDLYSLGTTLFVMVFGHPPYDDDDPNRVLRLHLKGEFPRLRRQHRVSPGAVRLIRRMMCRDRHRRHSSWEAFLEELRQVREQEPAERTSPGSQAPARLPALRGKSRRQLRMVDGAAPAALPALQPTGRRAARQLQVVAAAPPGRPPPTTIPVKRKPPLKVLKGN